MADEVAKTSIIVDASGAKRGADEFRASAAQILADDEKLQQAASRVADAVEKAEGRKRTARTAGAASARSAAQAEAASAELAAAGVTNATARIAETTSQTSAFLGRMERAHAPVQAAMQKTALEISRLEGIAASADKAAAARASGLLPAARGRLDTLKAEAPLQQAATQAIAASTAAQEKHITTSGQNRFATQQLGVQTIQFFSSIHSGIPVMQAFIQQGHQVVDVALTTGTGFAVLGNAIKSVGGFLISPIGLIGVAATAMVAMGAAAEGSQRRIAVLGNQLSIIRPDYAATAKAADDAAKTLARTTFLTTGEARAGIAAALQGGIVDPQRAAMAAFEMSRLAMRMGDVAEGARMTGEIVRDPAGFIETLLKANPRGLVEINQQLLDAVKRLQDAGKTGQAFETAMAAVARQNKQGSDTLSALDLAIRDLSKAFTGAGQSGKGFLEVFGTPLLDFLAKGISGFAALIEKVTALGEKLSSIKMPPGLAQQFDNAVGTALWPLSRGAELIGRGLNGAQTLASVVTGNQSPAALSMGQPTQAQLSAFGDPRQPGWSAANLVEVELGGKRVTVNAQAAAAFRGLARDLAAAGYPIQGANIGGFNPRNVAGTNTPSGHAFGVAIDIDPGLNPQVAGAGITAPNRMPANTAEVAARNGLIWGGNWRRPDYMHFEFPGTPDGARLAAATPGGAINVSGASAATGPVDQRTENLNQLLAKHKALLDNAPVELIRKYKTEYEDLMKVINNPETPKGQRDAAIQQLPELTKKIYEAIPAGEALIRTLNLQASAEGRMAEAWKGGAVEAEKMRIQIEAEAQARGLAGANNAEYEKQLRRNIAAITELTERQQLMKATLLSADIADQVEMYRKEAETMGLSVQAREKILAHLKLEQQLRRDLSLLPEQRAKVLREADGAKEIAQENQRLDAGARALADTFSQSFDTIGNAMAQAFVTGQGAAVNWANVMNAVIQQVIQQFMKLAVINPLLNALFPGVSNRPTLEDAWGGLSRASQNPGVGGIPGMIRGIGGLMGFGGDGLTQSAGATIGSWFGGLGGVTEGLGGMAGSVAAPISAFELMPAMFAHTGGIVGIDSGTPRYVHPAYFDDAPRLHSGMVANNFASMFRNDGLMADEFPAILQRGESVLTAGQQKALGDAMGSAMAGDTFHIVIQAPNVRDRQTLATFNASTPQLLRDGLNRATLAKSRNR